MPKTTKKSSRKSPARAAKKSRPSPKKKAAKPAKAAKSAPRKAKALKPKKVVAKSKKVAAKAKSPKAPKAAKPSKPVRESKSAATVHGKNGASKNGAAHKGPKATGAANGTKSAISVIDQPDVQEKLRELIRLAKEQGYLTFDDLNEALPENVNDPDEC